MLGTAHSDENGLAAFQADLPCGYRYFVRELTAPVGYQLNKAWKYELSFEDHPELEAQEMTAECMEKRLRASLRLQKVDMETGRSAPAGGCVSGRGKVRTVCQKRHCTSGWKERRDLPCGEQVTVLTTDGSRTVGGYRFISGSLLYKRAGGSRQDMCGMKQNMK